MFTRFVRLGVPTIQLDAQGRARPSLCALYSWRYLTLGNLPHVTRWPEYTVANPGFCYDYQLVNVEDFNGIGESEPTPYFYQVCVPVCVSVCVHSVCKCYPVPSPFPVVPRTWVRPNTLWPCSCSCGCRATRQTRLPFSPHTMGRNTSFEMCWPRDVPETLSLDYLKRCALFFASPSYIQVDTVVPTLLAGDHCGPLPGPAERLYHPLTGAYKACGPPAGCAPAGGSHVTCPAGIVHTGQNKPFPQLH